MNAHAQKSNALQYQRKTVACDHCRSLKVRCITPDEQSPCLKLDALRYRLGDTSDSRRCTKAGIICNVSRSKRIPQTFRPAKSRIIHLERRLDSILDLLSQRDADNSNNSSSSTGVDQLEDTPPTNAENILEPFNANHWQWNSAPELGAYSESSVNADSNTIDNPGATDDTFRSCYALGNTEVTIPEPVLQYLVTSFRQMAEYFPFVQLPLNLTTAQMAEEHPFLLLAAATAAAYEYPKLQQIFHGEVKEMITNYIVGDSECSLDLLQGLLVHLAWFHFHSKLRSGKTYTYLQLAISMATNLDLEHTTSLTVQDASGVQSNSLEWHDSEAPNLSYSDAVRTYLGCYYLSATTTSMTGKPNRLPLSEAMLQSAMNLQGIKEYATDSLIYPLIKLQHLAEDVREIYDLESSNPDKGRIHMHSERLLVGLKAWRSSISTDLASSALLETKYHAMHTRVWEMGLVFAFPQKAQVPGVSAGVNNIVPMHPKIMINLVKSIDAVKKLYGSFLSVPPAAYNYFPLSEWHQIIYATVVLYRLSTGLPEVAGWDVDLARQEMDLEGYLSLLIAHIRSGRIARFAQSGPSGTLFSLSVDILESVKRSYTTLRDHPDQDQGKVRAHIKVDTEINVEQISGSSGKARRCPGLRYLPAETGPADPSSDASSPANQDVIMEIEAVENLAFWQSVLDSG